MKDRVLIHTYFLALMLMVLPLTGCSELYRNANTELRPTKIENGYQCFQYKVIVADKSLMEKKGAEAEFVAWLEQSLAENGYPNAQYEIVSRKAIKHPTLIGDAYDIYYDVRVKVE